MEYPPALPPSQYTQSYLRDWTLPILSYTHPPSPLLATCSLPTCECAIIPLLLGVDGTDISPSILESPTVDFLASSQFKGMNTIIARDVYAVCDA
jgi:hypothetical protein